MLINLLVAVGLMGGLSLGLTSLVSRITKESKKASIKLSMITTKNTLLSGIMSDKVWTATMSHSVNTAAGNCFQNPLGSCAADMKFQLFDSNNRALTASANLNPGFTHNGRKCTGFDSVNGNSACPIGVNLILEKVCATPCYSPILNVQIAFEYKHPNQTYLFNMNRLSTQIMRSGASSNILSQALIESSTPCITSIYNGSVLFCQGEITRTINLDREAYLVLSSSVEVEFQPLGGAQSININVKSLKLTIEVNDIEVAADKVTSTPHLAGINEFRAQRSVAGSWTQKVGPGLVKLKTRYNAWIGWINTQPEFAKQNFFHLSYYIYK